MSIIDTFANTTLNAAKAGLGIGANSAITDSTSTDPLLRNRDYAVIITQDQDSEPGARSRVIVGSVPQSIQINQNVAWRAPFGAGLAGSGQIADILAMTGNRLVAQVLTMQVWQGSGNEFDFNVTFDLRAWSDPYLDVIVPIQTLLMMSVPSIDESGFLMSPGPVLDKEGIEKLGAHVTKTVVDAGKAGIAAFNNKKGKDTPMLDGENVQAGIAGGREFASQMKASGLLKKKTIEQYLKNKISIQIGRWFKMENVVIVDVQHDIKGQTPDGDTGQIQAASVTVSFRPMFAVTAEDVVNMFPGGSMFSPAAALPGNSPVATAFPVTL